MPLTSLLYVSDATLRMPDEEWQVEAIVEVARGRNARLDVTGALMFTYGHFAQVLEGSRDAVDELMTSIRRDPRHRNVNVLEVETITRRRFASWTMAYVGPAAFVKTTLTPLRLSEPISPFASQELIEVMQSLVALAHE